MTSRVSSIVADSSEGSGRKRVGKACDRCRLKKSKCDGNTPCSRCKADNWACQFGQRRKSQDKVHPKGYVEMLEANQHKLVACLRKFYTLVQNAEPWPGEPLQLQKDGHPLTHDVLSRLDLLEYDPDCSSPEMFEDDPSAMQFLLLQKKAGETHQASHGSSSSEGSKHTSRSSSPDAPPQANEALPKQPFFTGRLSQQSINPPITYMPANDVLQMPAGLSNFYQMPSDLKSPVESLPGLTPDEALFSTHMDFGNLNEWGNDLECSPFADVNDMYSAEDYLARSVLFNADSKAG